MFCSMILLSPAPRTSGSEERPSIDLRHGSLTSDLLQNVVNNVRVTYQAMGNQLDADAFSDGSEAKQ